MKIHLKDYGVTASITTRADGTARLIARDPMGKKVKDKVYANHKAARTAWARLCQ